MEEEEAGKLLETLRDGEEQLRSLKEQREKLLEANRKLVQLVEQLEDVMERIEHDMEGEYFSLEGHEYEYGRGWTPKKAVVEEALELDPDIDTEDVELQLEKIREMIKQMEKYKNQEGA